MTPTKRKTPTEIFAIPDVPREEVWVPEWQTSILMQGLTGAQRDAYEASITVGKGANQSINQINARAKLIVRCAINDDGTPFFTPMQVNDLGKKSANAIGRLFEAARKLSGLSEDDFDEMTEGFEPAQSAASPSA